MCVMNCMATRFTHPEGQCVYIQWKVAMYSISGTTSIKYKSSPFLQSLHMMAQSAPFIVLVAALLNTLSYSFAGNVYCVTPTATSCSSLPSQFYPLCHTLWGRAAQWWNTTKYWLHGRWLLLGHNRLPLLPEAPKQMGFRVLLNQTYKTKAKVKGQKARARYKGQDTKYIGKTRGRYWEDRRRTRVKERDEETRLQFPCLFTYHHIPAWRLGSHPGANLLSMETNWKLE